MGRSTWERPTGSECLGCCSRDVAGYVSTEVSTHLVVLAPGALPRHQFADGGTAGTRDRMLIGLHFGTRSFLTYGLDAEPDFLFFLIHLDDFEVVLLSGLEGQGLAVAIHRFGV